MVASTKVSSVLPAGKSLRLRMKAVTSADLEVSRRWHKEFMAELKAIGVPSALSEAWIVEPDLAIEMAVAEVFDQTPGPGAGRKIGQ